MSPNRKRSRSFGAPPAGSDGQPDALTIFRARMRAGDFNAIVGRKLRRALREAAADPSLDPEIGFLRLALIRLLTEEHDLSRLATSASRLGAVAVQAARLRHNAQSDLDEIRASLSRTLAEIDAESAATRAASLPGSTGAPHDPGAPPTKEEVPLSHRNGARGREGLG